jgi:hypothetical protein
MKKFFHLLFAIVLISSLAFPQTAKIKVEHVTPHSLTTLGLTTNSVSGGLKIIPNQTYAYFSAQDIAEGTISNATFELVSKPATSAAVLEILSSPDWTLLKPDVVGEYQVKLTITTGAGTDDTTQSFYAANYIGVGTVDGVPGTFPSCTSCHDNAGFPVFQSIFTRWATSGHATIFRTQIDVDSALSHYSTSCMKCHTTGYDHNLAAANNGFDDVAVNLGWVYPGHTNPGMWNNIKTNYTGLTKFGVIGCENCHGPGGEHAQGGSKAKIAINMEAGNCAQCHDEPWRHNIYSMYENSMHSEAVWERTTGSNANTNNLGDCIRCHDGQGFSNFTKGKTTDARTWTEIGNGTPVTCAACHDPHGNSNMYSLRSTPAGSDTLANGYSYTGMGGTGELCMNCHKSRANGELASLGSVSQRFGPHLSPQADVLLGKNAVQFGAAPYANGAHAAAITNACVDCHMVATTDTGTVTRDKVGGHSWNLSYNGYDHTTACTSCHGPKASFDDFVALMDYDGDGSVETVSGEIEGLLSMIDDVLPPAGPGISWTDIRASSDSTTLLKAWWNYQLIQRGGANGMHNAKFSIDVLSRTYNALGGVIPVELTAFTAEMNNGLVMLRWETATETNNRGFEIQRKADNSWQTVGFVAGKGTVTGLSSYSYSDNPVGIKNMSTLTYRLKQIDLDGKVNYSREINVEYKGAPKSFSLEQNYPNPFNPSTVIRYSVPTESNVKVVVYNLTGEVVKVLVNQLQAAGFHESTFSSNGISIASGIYFYTIEASPVNGGNVYRQTKKMILMK